MAKKIVYHGTWSDKPPHEYDKPFHAGTERAAHDRLSSGEGIPEGMGWMQTVHAYEIDDKDVEPTLYSDPHYGDTYSNIWKEKTPPHTRKAPETPNRIVKYLNDHEDRGSTSYLIPRSAYEEGRVRHMGVQFQDIDHTDPRANQ
jgi:hypothetical protein